MYLPRHAQLPCLLRQRLPQLSVPDHEEVGVRNGLQNGGQGLQQVGVPFLRVQPSDDADEWGKCRHMHHPPQPRPGLRARSRKLRQVHPVVNRRHFFRSYVPMRDFRRPRRLAHGDHRVVQRQRQPI